MKDVSLELMAEGSSSSTPFSTFRMTVTSSAKSGSAAAGYCIIALNPTMADALYFRGTGDFVASNCSAHADSSDGSAVTVQGNSTASATGFSAVGGYQVIGGGKFSPTPVAGAAKIGDPFSVSVSTPGGACLSQTIKKQNGAVTLSPGKYCDIDIQTQGNVTMSAGTYYISGSLAMGSQAELAATSGVTLIFTGSTSVLSMNSGSSIKLYAPQTGQYAGFAVIQDPSVAASVTHNVQGGANTEIRGIWYTKTGKLYVTGGGGFNQTSGYFPMVVDNLEVGGNGQVNVGFDWSTYGYPKPEPLYRKSAVVVTQ